LFLIDEGRSSFVFGVAAAGFRTRCEYLPRCAVLRRLQVRGSPSLANPLGGTNVHWKFASIRLAHVRSIAASLRLTVRNPDAATRSAIRIRFWNSYLDTLYAFTS
jgi:hypothetical protein